jgi:ABC-type glutathione transport system ATPase component
METPGQVPKEQRTPEMEIRLQEMLDLVGIGYLVKRWAGDADETNYEEHHGWDHIVRWEDVLSLGEQQRMGVARMFWHAPKIGEWRPLSSALHAVSSSESFPVSEPLLVPA